MKIKCKRLLLNSDGTMNVSSCGKDATVDREVVMALSHALDTRHAFYILSLCDEHGEEYDHSPASYGIERSNRRNNA